jgi:hypothetical protein
MKRSSVIAAFAVVAACGPTPEPAPVAAPLGPTSSAVARSASAPQTSAAATPPAPAPSPTSDTSSSPSSPSSASPPSSPSALTAVACAEADVRLDLRAWPTTVQIDIPQESAYQASKFRDSVPKGVTVRVYPKSSYGFVARFDAENVHEAFARCAAGVAAYLPGAPTRHPLDHTPVVVKCHRCGQGLPDGASPLP